MVLHKGPVCKSSQEDGWLSLFFPHLLWYLLWPVKVDLGNNFLNGFLAHSPIHKPIQGQINLPWCDLVSLV